MWWGDSLLPSSLLRSRQRIDVNEEDLLSPGTFPSLLLGKVDRFTGRVRIGERVSIGRALLMELRRLRVEFPLELSQQCCRALSTAWTRNWWGGGSGGNAAHLTVSGPVAASGRPLSAMAVLNHSDCWKVQDLDLTAVETQLQGVIRPA